MEKILNILPIFEVVSETAGPADKQIWSKKTREVKDLIGQISLNSSPQEQTKLFYQ